MPRRAEPHHVGHRRAGSALLLIDFLQPFRDEGGVALWRRTRTIVPAVLALRAGARTAGVPVIYVNDHLGAWHGSQERHVAAAGRGARGDVARALAPGPRDLFVFKPARSAFYGSPLETLLEALGVRRVVLAGVATDVCVLATATDATIRKLRCAVPEDCSAAEDEARHRRALALMAETMEADVRPRTAWKWGREKGRRGGWA